MAFELHLHGFKVVALAPANVACDVNVRQKVHFDALKAVALAGFAAATLHVETEAPRFIAALTRFRQQGVKFANGREKTRVSGRVRARRAPNGGLINADDFVYVRDAGDLAMRARRFMRPVNLFGQRTIKNIVHQGGFPAAGDTRDHDETPQREFHVHTFQIVLCGTVDADEFTAALAPLGRGWNLSGAGQILPGERVRVGANIGRGAGCHKLSTQAPCTGPQIDHIVRAFDCFGVVLHHKNGVAHVTQ